MLYWEEEIATYRTTKKGFARGMCQVAFLVQLKGVIDEIERVRKMEVDTDNNQEVKRTGEVMSTGSLEQNMKKTKCKVDDMKTQ